MGRKYRFRDRASAESECARLELQLTLHRIALDCILRGEFTMTRRFTADNGAWFEMGIARASSAHGGLVLVREFYPCNLKPSQRVEWADGWTREMGQHFCGYTPSDDEGLAYRDCFLAIRAMYNVAVAA